MSSTLNAMSDGTNTIEIEDVQGSPDTRQLAINKVGIKGIRHPIQFRDRAGVSQPTVATFNMYVDLSKEVKGTHMSRFVEILNRIDGDFTIETFGALLPTMADLLDADSGFVEMTFPYFVNKKAPVSGVASLIDYEVTLVGKVVDGALEVQIKVVVPVTSLCPCSKKISDYGAHNQRSHVTAHVYTAGEPVWIEEIIDVVEQEASCQLYGLLKRPDEKFVTEYAYDNPKFVEDMVRDVAARFNADHRITGYVIESENFESIHNHSAYAMIEKR